MRVVFTSQASERMAYSYQRKPKVNLPARLLDSTPQALPQTSAERGSQTSGQDGNLEGNSSSRDMGNYRQGSSHNRRSLALHILENFHPDNCRFRLTALGRQYCQSCTYNLYCGERGA